MFALRRPLARRDRKGNRPLPSSALSRGERFVRARFPGAFRLGITQRQLYNAEALDSVLGILAAIVKELVSEVQIRDAVERLAAEIRVREAGRPLTVIGVMTGSIVLVADLIRKLDMPLRVGIVQASSYLGGTQSGELIINAELLPDIAGRDVLLVDDIFDTGRTLAQLVTHLRDLGPGSLRTAVLMLKRGRQEVTMRPDYVAFEIPDEFVVGYGLDYRDLYRNLPFIAALEPHEIAGHGD
jgi:hypoxanthine phosphoribosyltransferase